MFSKNPVRKLIPVPKIKDVGAMAGTYLYIDNSGYATKTVLHSPIKNYCWSGSLK